MNPDYKPAMVAIAHDHYRARRVELAKYALQAVLDGFGESSPPRDKDNPDAHLIRGLIERQEGAARRGNGRLRRGRGSARPGQMVEALIDPWRR